MCIVTYRKFMADSAIFIIVYYYALSMYVRGNFTLDMIMSYSY